VARFALPASGEVDYGEVPFPSDLYRDASGAVTIGAVPSSRTDDPFFVSLRGMLGARGGFCSTCALHFYLDGELDPASVPASRAPSDAASASDAIVLLDLDAGAPHLVPLRVWYDPTLDHLAIHPVRGITLGAHHRWAAALTTQLRALDGSPLRASDAFAAIRDGRDASHPDLSRAIDALAAAGVPRATIAVATVFTTDDTGRELVALRTALHAAPLGTITVEHVYGTAPGADGTLDDLFGVPAVDRPGVDVPSMAGAVGPTAMIHEAIGTVVLGRFTAPRVVEGTGTDVGVPLVDASGMPRAGASEDVPFVLAIPAGAASLASMPVLFVHHGFNASRVTALTMADTAARAGWATFGIDAFQHGARAEGAMDVQHNLRGSMGADGLAETSVASVSARTFGIVGPPAGMALYPGYPLGAFTQFAADVMSSVRLLREADLAPITAVVPALAGLSFDRARIGYLGISMGSVIGASIVAAEPDVRAAVLVVPPGSIVESLCEGVAFRGLTTGTLANLLHIDGRFDEVTHACVGDPIVDLVRWSLEPIDPLALAPRFFEAPLDPAGPRPDVVWVMSANDEVASPPATESMLAAAGVSGVGTFASAPIAPVTLPATANLPWSGGTATALAVRLAPASHGLCEVQGADENYALPIEPPFTPLPTPVHYENPIAEAHARIGAFLGTISGAGRGSFR
jgi:dienelactone hydrolase